MKVEFQYRYALKAERTNKRRHDDGAFLNMYERRSGAVRDWLSRWPAWLQSEVHRLAPGVQP